MRGVVATMATKAEQVREGPELAGESSRASLGGNLCECPQGVGPGKEGPRVLGGSCQTCWPPDQSKAAALA